MIIEYHRPANFSDAIALLSRDNPLTLPLGGGTSLSHEFQRDIAAVDLQLLGLNKFEMEGQLIRLGATVTLQQLYDVEDLPQSLSGGLRESLRHEVGRNLRQRSTLAGVVISCDGRSPLITTLLALDSRLTWAPGDEVQALGDFLPLREKPGNAALVTDLRMPLNAALDFSMVARTPMDRPVVCAAIAQWPSGRTRIALGGFGSAPILAMDGPEPGGAVYAAREAFRFSDDAWASAEYRMDVAGKLVQRMLKKGRS